MPLQYITHQHEYSYSLEPQTKKLGLQPLLQRTSIRAEMRYIERLARPVPTRIVFIVAEQVNAVIECSGCNPFEFLCRIWEFSLDGLLD